MYRVSRFLVSALVVSFCSYSLSAQGLNPSCQTMPYENHNQIDYGPLRIGFLVGTVKDIQGIEIRGACIGVFTDTDKKLLVTTQSDETGHFTITGLPNGNYRLVISADGLCTAYVRIVLRNGSRRKQKLLTKMRPTGIDACSWIELH